ncbi:efflux RND transporter periplasmic adaptor subunit [Leptolyngbya sp. FACHB-36]|uniref:efflux RND transporter periplasmic adaptor subunit n=1 Tax=Leptolyngbya sp. FACHB-36 TaxID=2692808 RepID=UPI0016804A09|nr:efflux RND transporter periplasmic adaptor subunit [Leptolyngbya sp. FACHB-36]
MSWLLLAGSLLLVSSCSPEKERAGAEPQPFPVGKQVATPVEVAVAKPAVLKQPIEYTGKARPLQELTLRAQSDGQLLKLNAKVGDRIRQDQPLVQIDDAALKTAISDAQSQLAAQRSQVTQLQARAALNRQEAEQAQTRYRNAQNEATRLDRLARNGTISRQRAEQARATAKSAAEALRSIQRRSIDQQTGIAEARGRLSAQQTSVVQARERQSFAVLTSPVSGYVLEQLASVGDSVTSGTELLRLGNFSRVKLTVQVLERERKTLSVGDSVELRFNALPKQVFTGAVGSISPVADAASLIPVEITVANGDGKIGIGMVAKVRLEPSRPARVLVPIAAVQDDRNAATAKQATPSSKGVVYVFNGTGSSGSAEAREVVLGDRADGKVEILSGLKAGERFVTRSGTPLKGGDPVRVSLLP